MSKTRDEVKSAMEQNQLNYGTQVVLPYGVLNRLLEEHEEALKQLREARQTIRKAHFHIETSRDVAEYILGEYRKIHPKIFEFTTKR